MAVAFVHIIRLAAMAVAILFSIITLGLSAGLTHTTEQFNFYYKFAAMGIAVSLLTLFTLPVLIVVDFLRQGAFTSLIAVELGWLGILWVLWLATGSLAADAGLFPDGCPNSDFVSNIFTTACHEYQAVQAFAFLTWIVLKGYWILLLVASIIGVTRGHPIWTSTVKDNLFFTPRVNAGPGEVKYEAQYPQQQYQTTGQAQQYPPQQYPPQQGVQQGTRGYPSPMPQGQTYAQV